MIKNFLKTHPMHKQIAGSLDLFFLVMPTSYFIVWVLLAIGMYVPMQANESILMFITSYSLKTVVLFISVSLLVSSILITKQKNEQSIEENVYKKINNPVLINKIKVLFFVLSLILLCIVHVSLILCGVIMYYIGEFLYSRKYSTNDWYPFLRIICITILTLSIICAGYLHQINNNLTGDVTFSIFSIFFICLPYIFIMISISIMKDISDYHEDENIIVLSNVFNKKIVSLISLFLLSIALYISVIINDPLSSTSIIVFYTFFIYSLIRGFKKDYIRSINYTVGILNFFIVTIYPYLFIFVFICFYISKYYYWHRFDVHYPTFLVDND